MNRSIPSSVVAIAVSLASARADVTFVEKPDRVIVNINGALFTEYHHGDAPHVYYWPLIGPGGAKMTRAFPMEKVEGDSTDHYHHRSFWFAHGALDGIDFWTEMVPGATKPPKLPYGAIQHVKVLAMEPGKDSGVLKTEQKWVTPDGVEHLHSVQALRIFAGSESERMFDLDVTLTAGEKDAVFGDSKEGSVALRIADSMRVKQVKGPGKGHIVSSEGIKDDKVWGQHAKWVTMSGPIGGKTFSITLMDHPSNLRHPTRWHARDYGLFGANPFCEAQMDKTRPAGAGDYTLKAGQSLAFKYRIVITEGDESAARQAERYEQFAKGAAK